MPEQVSIKIRAISPIEAVHIMNEQVQHLQRELQKEQQTITGVRKEVCTAWPILLSTEAITEHKALNVPTATTVAETWILISSKASSCWKC
jgi:hypothetical protein